MAEIFRELVYRIRLGGSIASPRFRHILGTFSGHRRVTRRLFTTLTGIKAHFPGLLINSFQKKTFTKSLGGGGHGPPAPPGYATVTNLNIDKPGSTLYMEMVALTEQ